MKELLSIKEKAHRYDKALRVVKKLHSSWKETRNRAADEIEAVFPELRESEDENIKQYLISFIKMESGVNLSPDDAGKILSWVEKQGEQKPADEVKPKFKVGDIISNGISEVKIISIDKDNYNVTNSEVENDAHVCNWVVYFKDQDNWELVEQKPTDNIVPKFKVGDWVVYERSGNTYQIHSIDDSDSNYIVYACEPLLSNNDDIPCFCEEMIHLWTVQDAKVGDVLSFNDGHGNDGIELIKSITDKKIEFWFCLTNGNDYEVFDGITPYTNFVSREKARPATKEQRDLLFSKMKKAGYEWDEGKKVLEKIEQTPAAYFYCKYVGTTPKCGDCVRNHLNSKYKIEDIKTWMTPASRGTKQCSDYVPKDSVKWSEEDDRNLSIAIQYVFERGYLSTVDWLKSLKERVQQPMWSKEDENGLGDALWAIKLARTIALDENEMGNLWYAERWLTSLKEKMKGE